MLFAVSDTVWLGLFTLLTLLVKEYFDYRKAARVSAKIDDNTAKTVETKNEVKAAAADAVQAAKVAATAATKASNSTTEMRQQIKESTESITGLISESNGGSVKDTK